MCQEVAFQGSQSFGGHHQLPVSKFYIWRIFHLTSYCGCFKHDAVEQSLFVFRGKRPLEWCVWISCELQSVTGQSHTSLSQSTPKRRALGGMNGPNNLFHLYNFSICGIGRNKVFFFQIFSFKYYKVYLVIATNLENSCA